MQPATALSDTLGRFGFPLLKAVNLGLLTLYSFALVYVLVRVVPHGFYPWMVLLASIGGYVLASDLGFSNYVYSVVRRDFLAGRVFGAAEIVSRAIGLYLAVALGATVAAGLLIPVLAPRALAVPLVCYFATIVMPFPWMLVRRAAAAIDLFGEIELIECVRRLLFCGLLGAMLAGWSLLAFSLACLAGWLATALVAAALLRRHGCRLRLEPPTGIGRFLAEHRHGLFASSRFTLLEFFIYYTPYAAIPLLFHGPAELVSFDLFNKVTRFGGAVYAVPAEVFGPAQTRAYYAGRHALVRRFQRLTWVMGAPPLALGAALLLGEGDALFGRLLAGSHMVEAGTRVAMVLMLAAVLAQSSAGSFLLAVGRYAEVSATSRVTVALIAALYGLTALTGLSFPTFMLLYVAAYGVHALLFQLSFARLIGERRTRRLLLASDA